MTLTILVILPIITLVKATKLYSTDTDNQVTAPEFNFYTLFTAPHNLLYLLPTIINSEN